MCLILKIGFITPLRVAKSIIFGVIYLSYKKPFANSFQCSLFDYKILQEIFSPYLHINFYQCIPVKSLITAWISMRGFLERFPRHLPQGKPEITNGFTCKTSLIRRYYSTFKKSKSLVIKIEICLDVSLFSSGSLAKGYDWLMKLAKPEILRMTTFYEANFQLKSFIVGNFWCIDVRKLS